MSAAASCLSNFDRFFHNENLGFQFDKLKEKFSGIVKNCPLLKKLIDFASVNGYTFAGEPKNKYSKANTNTQTKEVRVTDQLLSGESVLEEKLQRQVLSLTYELTNVENGEELDYIIDSAKFGDLKDPDIFVDSILKIEAKAQFNKLYVFLKMKEEGDVSKMEINPIYLQVFLNGRSENKEKSEIIEDLHQAMVLHGTLKRTGKKVTEHYKEMFYSIFGKKRNQSPISVIEAIKY
jgi:hypothetical protein